ncbi:MAG: hypothetical protein ACK4K7_08365 [Allosphingosinicella sp.]|uniref:hypothetical protein n=1 Tax=Allosphingosinicella sp. TaxID=2823234 RepID=UPI003962DB12
MKKISILAGIAALTVSGTALAQSGGYQRGADRNVDVTRAEAAAKANQAFQRLDLNRDGRVTPEEMRQARQQMRAERLAQLTPEQRAAMEQRRAQRGDQARSGGWKRGDGERSGQRGQRMFGEQGFVTAEQFQARALQRFDRMDLNNDGVVTAEERRQAREQMRQRGGERRGGRG